MKILLVYPNITDQPQIQLGMAVIAAVLKQNNHILNIFDTTFLMDKSIEEIQAIFKKKIESFHPGLISISCRSLEYYLVKELLKVKGDITSVVGGPHATVCPNEVINNPFVDIVCIGEGEGAILELANKLENKQDISQIKNLWIKSNGKIIKNKVRFLQQNLDLLPMPDWELFDKRHVAQKIGRFETSRGCPYLCSYCINAFMQNLYKGKGAYHRKKSIHRIIEEIKFFIDKYDLKSIFFIDETFLLDFERLKNFCEKYKKEINLPFGIMTRAETVTLEKLKIIKDAGCDEISIGIESGDMGYRKNMLNRNYTQEELLNAFRFAKKIDIKTYSFNMIGLPCETRDSIFKTIEINRKTKADEIQTTIFYPFHGTKLREFCEQKNLIKNKSISSYYKETIIKNPYLTEQELYGLHRTFIIYCKSPKFLFPIVRLLEKNNPVSKGMCSILNVLIKQKWKLITTPVVFTIIFDVFRRKK